MQAAAGAVEDSVDDGGDEVAHERGAFGGDQRARAAGQDEPVPVDPGVETEAGKDADELVVRVARSGGRDGLAAPAGAEPAECPRVGLRRAQGGAEQLRHRQEALVRDGPVLPEAEDGAGAAWLVRRPRLALDEAVRLEGAHVGAGGVGVDAGGLRQVLEGGGAARREPANEPGANGISDCIDHGNHFLQKIVGNSPPRCVADADPRATREGVEPTSTQSASDRWTWIALARPLLGAGVRLETLDRPLDRPVVVPAEDRAKDRGEDAEEWPVGDDAPVEVDVDLAVPLGERPHALAG